MRVLITGFIAALGSPALAQGISDDPMAYQACIHGCLSTYGFNSSEYPACITQQCDGGGTASGSSTATAVPTNATVGRWGLASFQNLGVGAMVQTPDAMLHLACLPSGGAEPTAELTLRAPGFRSDRVLVAFVGADSMVNMERTGRGAYKLRGFACDVPISELQAASAAIVLEGFIESIAVGQDTVVTSGGANYAISQGGQLAGIPGAITVPLTGSSSAISQLVQTCPVLVQDLAAPCG